MSSIDPAPRLTLRRGAGILRDHVRESRAALIAVVVLALLMVPVFFVVVQRLFAGDRSDDPVKAGVKHEVPAQIQPRDAR